MLKFVCSPLIRTVFFTLFIFATSVKPAVKADGEEQALAPPPQQAGKWALQFGITSNFTLGSLDGSMISIKRQYSKRAAIRLGLDIKSSVSNSTSEQVRMDTTQSEQAEERREHSIYLNSYYMHYSKRNVNMIPYIGLGPKFSYSNTSTTTEVKPFSTDRNIRNRNQWSIGLAGVMGVEWVLTGSIGLIAEYHISAYYDHMLQEDLRKDNSITTAGNIRNIDTYQFQSGPIRFGVSVYF